MTNKKFLLISLVAATMAGVVALYSCNKNDLTPAEDGKNLARELCACITKAGNDDAKKLDCLSDFEKKADKWKDENDAQAFEDAFNQEIESCSVSPYQWYYAYLGQIAVGEFCDFFNNTPAAADPSTGLNLLMSGGLYGKYAALFYEPVFMGAVLTGLLTTCPSVPDWYYCAFGMEDRCPEDLEELGLRVAEELCDCLAEADNQGAQTACVYELFPYFGLMENPEFTGAFYGKVGTSCPEALALIEALMASGGGQ